MICTRILIGPEVPDPATLGSIVARLAHYLSHTDIERIVIVLAPGFDVDAADALLAEPPVPEGFDPVVRDRVAQIRSSIVFHPGPSGLRSRAVDCDVLLLWESAALERSPWDQIATAYRLNRTMFVVDSQANRDDGIWFADAAMMLARGSRRFDAADVERFRDRTAHLTGAARAYLIATGPSARMALDHDLADGVRIVCNTVVLDDELMAHVAPDIVTFADPIFHFGPSTYAHEFQRALERQAHCHDFTIVTVERFAVLLRHQLPELADRIVGVRLGSRAWEQNLDLRHELAVRPYPNILTMLMLPLAATLAHEIKMIGFDGRSPDETYFWRHGGTVQFDRELEDIKVVHPGFFALDYADYYAQHVKDVELMLWQIERSGVPVSPLTPSFMAPLRRRAHSPGLDPLASDRAVADSGAADLIVSITPDWVDRFGHFGPWEHAVGRAARRHGFEHRSLASKARVPEEDTELQAFTHPTISPVPFDASGFERELREQLRAVRDRDHTTYVAFYTADIWHLPSLLSVARDHPQMLFVANLMRAHARIAAAAESGATDASMQLLRLCLETAAGSNLVVCIDTQVIADEVNALTGFPIPTWPMITVADPQRLERAASEHRRHHRVRVVAPIQTQQGKGFADVASLAERLANRLHRGRLSLAVRFLAQPNGHSLRDIERSSRLTAAGGELIEGDLTDDQYARMIADADVILLPYRRAVFRTRTSGVLLDAVAAGKPVIATRGTWAGDLVERFSIGATFRDGDADDLHNAVKRVTRHRRSLQRQVHHQRRAIVERFAPARLVEFLVAQGAAVGELRQPSEMEIARARRLACSLVEDARQLERERAEQQITDHVRADDQRRARDEQADETEPPLRPSRWGMATSSDARPVDKVTGSPASAAATGLEQRELWRQAAVRVDELRLVGRLVRPTAVGGDPAGGLMVIAAGGKNGHADASRDHSVGDVAAVLADPLRVATDLHGIAHVDLLRIDDPVVGMAVLERFPWERLRPSAVLLSFDDHQTASLGHVVRDLAERLVAYGYQVWISDWYPGVNGGSRPGWQRLVTYVGTPVHAAANGHLVALLEPVPFDVMGATLTDILRPQAELSSAQRVPDHAATSIRNGDEPVVPTAAR